MFGYSSYRSLLSAVDAGNFPKPDFYSGLTRSRAQWSLPTLEAEKKRREKEQDHVKSQ